MPTPSPIEYADASPQVRSVYDDIKKTRNVSDVNNFWKFLARDPATLKRTWESVKEVMAAGAIDPLTKEMIYLAVSVTNGCGYCIASHTAAARKAGMTEAMVGELMAVVGMANETNRLANGYRVPIDAAFNT
jgi:AhpD family alkylhydroperoxidase